MLRRFLIAFCAGIGLASQSVEVGAFESGYDWSGLYIGVNAGLISNNSSLDISIEGMDDHSNALRDVLDGDQSSLMGGGLIGYSIQASNFVLGAEADLNYLRYSITKSKLEAYDIYAATQDATFDASWLGTLRARGGIAAAGFLIYGTAGLAAGNMQATATVKAVDVVTGDVSKWSGSTEATSWGWTAGGGVEYGISNVSFGLEYLYVDLGSEAWSGRRRTEGKGDQIEAKGTAHYQFGLTRATAKLHF